MLGDSIVMLFMLEIDEDGFILEIGIVDPVNQVFYLAALLPPGTGCFFVEVDQLGFFLNFQFAGGRGVGEDLDRFGVITGHGFINNVLDAGRFHTYPLVSINQKPMPTSGYGYKLCLYLIIYIIYRLYYRVQNQDGKKSHHICGRRKLRDTIGSVDPMNEFKIAFFSASKAKGPDNERNGGEGSESAAQVDQGHDHENAGGPVSPEAFDGGDIPGQVFQITDGRFAQQRLGKPRHPAGADGRAERS